MIKRITATVLLIMMLASTAAFGAVPAGHWFESGAPVAAEFYKSVNNADFNPDEVLTYAKFADVATNGIGRAISYATDKADKPITRYEALTIICERMNYSYDLDQETELAAAIAIADFNDMPQEYKQTALICVNRGLIKGDENSCVNMDSPITYAEALTIFVRLKAE